MKAEASTFIRKLRQDARAAGRSVALPESSDPRVLEAACQLLDFGAAGFVQLFGNPAQVMDIAKKHNIQLGPYSQAIRWARPDDLELATRTLEHCKARAASRDKVICDEDAKQIMASPLDKAAFLLATGTVDALVAGCVATTAEVIRAAIRGIGLSPGNKTISGSFAMVREGSEGPRQHYMFADCGVVIDPNPEQLVDIAAATASTFQALFPSEKPVLAFLSFSTKGSADHPHARKMAEAATLFATRFPQIVSDGELQFDAAFNAEVAKRKAPGSPVAGGANCFVFPDLDAGNIAYKITQRLAGFDAYGPILQGTAKPLSDLSRGASSQDITVAAMIAMLRAQS